MFLILIFILTVGGLAIYFSDLESESALHSIVLPIVVTLALITLALWLVALFHKLGVKQTYSSSSDGSGPGIGGDIGGGEGGL